MAIEFTSLGKPPTPNGNLLVVDGLNLAFRWKHQKKEFFKVEYLRTIESLAKSSKMLQTSESTTKIKYEEESTEIQT